MRLISLLTCIILLTVASCNNPAPKKTGSSGNTKLTEFEQLLFDSLKMDPSIMDDIRKYTSTPIAPFEPETGVVINDGNKPMYPDALALPGIMFESPKVGATGHLISQLRQPLLSKGYFILKVEDNFGRTNDNIAVLKTTDKFQVLRALQTDGINFDIDNDSLITIIKHFDDKYSLELRGASLDWCEFTINKPPSDWLALAREVYEVCPDVVDQGSGSIEALAAEMKKYNTLYFWWD